MKQSGFFIPVLSFLLTLSCGLGKQVGISFTDPCQTVLTSGKTTVCIDVITKKMIRKETTGKTWFLSTRRDNQHYSPELAEKFVGTRILFKEGVIQNKTVIIHSIPSAYSEYDEFQKENGSNYIFVVEMGGLRIAHLGEIGQPELTEEQLRIIGPVDICFAPIENSHTDMSVENRKGFNLINQINPKIVIPTIYRDRAVAYAQTQYPVKITGKKSIIIRKRDLPEETTLLIMGPSAEALKSMLNLEEWR